MKKKIILEIELPERLQENGIVVFDIKQKSLVIVPQSQLTTEVENKLVELERALGESKAENKRLTDIILEIANADDEVK